MIMKKIGLIRHGETAWNRLGKAQGHSDIPLNDFGRKQAHLIGERLMKGAWEYIYSSDLLRAKETAEIIATYTKTSLLTDRRLRERHGGLIEGTTEAERIKKWGDNWRSLNLGVESGESMSQRGLSFLEELLEQHIAKNILIVSHGAFLKQLLHTLVPNQTTGESLTNCSLTILYNKDKQWDLKLHNCCNHLKL